MPARKIYEDFYETGSAARKRKQETTVKKSSRPVKTGKNKVSSKVNIKKKNNISMVVFILSGFLMAMVVTYRFNIISEKNLEIQNLKEELLSVESALLSTQIEVEQSTDLNQIEAYAKQKLGMQKPDKNQTIYIDTSRATSAVEIDVTDESSFSSLVEKVKDFINKIF